MSASQNGNRGRRVGYVRDNETDAPSDATIKEAMTGELAEWQARAAVLGIPRFPAREAEFVRLFSPPAGIFLHQLVYWFEEMGWRQWIYKTFAEFEEERGLSRRQVIAARRRLVGAGVLEERHGKGNRIYYRILWAVLAAKMGLWGFEENARLSEHSDKNARLTVHSSLHATFGGSEPSKNGKNPCKKAES